MSTVLLFLFCVRKERLGSWPQEYKEMFLLLLFSSEKSNKRLARHLTFAENPHDLKTAAAERPSGVGHFLYRFLY